MGALFGELIGSALSGPRLARGPRERTGWHRSAYVSAVVLAPLILAMELIVLGALSRHGSCGGPAGVAGASLVTDGALLTVAAAAGR